MNRRCHSPILTGIAAGVVAVALLFVAYMSGYCTEMLEHREFNLGFGNPTGVRPVYRTENLLVEGFFWPANQIDRQLRPRPWRLEAFLLEEE